MKSSETILWMAERLGERFGPISIPLEDPVETLVLTILSQNTNDTNRDRAYASLVETFGDLESVRSAPIEKIAEAIRSGGLHQQKAKHISDVLRRIHNVRGRLDLSFLGGMDTTDALAWLQASPGVGPKTAGIVLLFAFNKPFFPVDTHIRRVLGRMGLVASSEDPHRPMNRWLPADPELMRRLHLQMIRLGREVCHPRKPECGDCPLGARCPWRREQQRGE